MTTKSPIYQAGYDAYAEQHTNGPRTHHGDANPYNSDTLSTEYYDWQEGWMDAADWADQHDIPRPRFFTVAVCLATLRYGGPEEGGWWYTDYEALYDGDFPLPQLFLTRAEAEAKEKELIKLCDVANIGRRPISDSNSDGIFTTQVYDEFPTPTPRPHYE